MRSKLVPISTSLDTLVAPLREPGTFAIMNRVVMESLARMMPDAQSAVLFCLAWHAALQARMQRGRHAGRPVARVSAANLAMITGRPLRTVRYALSKLRASGAIAMDDPQPGRTAIYLLAIHQSHEDWESQRPDKVGGGV